MHRLFVCHVSEDRAKAMEIVRDVEARGLKCWIAPRDVRPGTPYDDEIAEAIERSEALLLVFSDRSNDSDYIRREVTLAGEMRKRIIPLRIEDAQPKRGLRVRLTDLHWIDAFPKRAPAIELLLNELAPAVAEAGPALKLETPVARAPESVLNSPPSDEEIQSLAKAIQLRGRLLFLVTPILSFLVFWFAARLAGYFGAKDGLGLPSESTLGWVFLCLFFSPFAALVVVSFLNRIELIGLSKRISAINRDQSVNQILEQQNQKWYWKFISTSYIKRTGQRTRATFRVGKILSYILSIIVIFAVINLIA